MSRRSTPATGLAFFLAIFMSFQTAELWPGLALADDLPKTDVVFFGGYGSTHSQMEAWKAAAEKEPQYQQDFNFDAVALPSHHWLQHRVIRDSERTIRAWVYKIDHAPANQVFVLAGHSSGSALSNEIARRVRNKLKIRLVVLDGFAPRGVSEEVQTQCWTAVDGADPRHTSMNAKAMRSCHSYRHSFHEFKPRGCRTQMCLHFSLVNSNSIHDDINRYNFKVHGYRRVQPNLGFLNEYMPGSPTSMPSSSGSR